MTRKPFTIPFVSDYADSQLIFGEETFTVFCAELREWRDDRPAD